MPELPEVETIRRQLEPHVVGADVVGAWAFPSSKFDEAPAAIGHTVTGVGRRGKYLLFDLEAAGTQRQLVVHLGMTGRLAVPPGRPGDDPDVDERFDHLRASWSFDDGRALLFDDVRRFGRLAVVDHGEHSRMPTLAALGPEPWDETFTPEHLRHEVNSRRRAVKTLLLSQRVVAGVGNIYADEALWRAGVHPSARRLTVAQADRLRDTVRDVLREGVDHGGTTLRNYRDAEGGSGEHQRFLDCYGRYGEPCIRCGDELRRSVVDARTTTFCATCQRR